jgi:curved DNA-binding protein CbpA
MTKQHYKLFAEAISRIEDKNKREEFINFLEPILKSDNYRFDSERFREYIKRLVNGESLKGLR